MTACECVRTSQHIGQLTGLARMMNEAINQVSIAECFKLDEFPQLKRLQ